MADLIDLEMAATMPWTVAEGGSLWIASGTHPEPNGGTFQDCLLRCVPEFIHGTEGRLFEVLLYGERKLVGPADITRAKEVFLVWADEPLEAVYVDDQDTIDHALAERGDRRG